MAYYAQAGWGGVKLLSGNRPIEKVLADPATPSELRLQLQSVLDIRDFAVSDLALPDNGSYRRYADLDRPFASWVVMAAPEFSLEPIVWCFPVAGCVSYRGYFSEPRAQRFADRLRQDGLDVDVRGVKAFSTIGWFKDPVLSTFVTDPPVFLAELLFHEMAHQVVYVKGDTTFNESFATFVEEEGIRRWIAARNDPQAADLYAERRKREDQLFELLSGCRAELESIYREDIDDAAKRRQKEARFERLTEDYRRLERSWGLEPSVGPADLDNADLAAVSAYHELVPAFRALFVRHQESLEAFYQAVGELADLPESERNEALRELAETSRVDVS